jgi:hypothetical protein
VRISTHSRGNEAMRCNFQRLNSHNWEDQHSQRLVRAKFLSRRRTQANAVLKGNRLVRRNRQVAEFAVEFVAGRGFLQQALKISPGAVKLQDLTRERQMEFGRKRANKVPCQRCYRIRSHSAAHKLGRHDRDSASHSSSIDTLDR